MKKTLIALAALASFAGVASAQSSVTLFGIVDATLQHGSGNGAVGNSVTRLGNSGLSSSQLGFRGIEDLGGGMSASFWLEAGVNNDDGTGSSTSSTNQIIGAFAPATGANAPVRSGTQGLTFNRRSTVSLGGAWGEVRLGRDYTPQFRNITVFDPFGTNGVGTNQILNSITASTFAGGFNIPTAVRASNSIAYLYNMGTGTGFIAGAPGLYGTLQYYMGENASNATAGLPLVDVSDNGRGWGGRIGYTSGPFNVALSTSRTQYAVGGGAPGGNARMTNLGGSWDFGMAAIMAQYERDSVGPVDGRGYLVGATMPVGPGLIRASYARYRTDFVGEPTSKKWALGYVHNLSKRTALYATYAHVSNSAGANQSLNGAATSLGGSSSGYDFGLKHSF